MIMRSARKTTYIHNYFRGSRYRKHIGKLLVLRYMFPSFDMEKDDIHVLKHKRQRYSLSSISSKLLFLEVQKGSERRVCHIDPVLLQEET